MTFRGPQLFCGSVNRPLENSCDLPCFNNGAGGKDYAALKVCPDRKARAAFIFS